MKKGLFLAGAAIGIAGGVGYLLASKGSKRSAADTAEPDQSSLRAEQAVEDKRIDRETSMQEAGASEALDDRGTDQAEAFQILRSVRDEGFEGSDEKLAVALGRPLEEIEEWTSGAGAIDGDVILKARGLANQRGINLGG